MKRYARLWLVPLMLAALSLGGLQIARGCWDSLVNFRAPRFTVEPGATAPPLGRVVLVVVDGLRTDALERMPGVSRLKARSAFYVVKTGQPSLSLPGSAVIATGAWQDVTGVTTNWFAGPEKKDSLFSLAKAKGVSAALAGEDGWGRLFGGQSAMTYTRPWKDAYTTFDEETLARALEFLSAKPALLVVHFVDADNAGHDFGAASGEYRKYVGHIDTLISRLQAALGDDTVFIVTSDHGQLDKGGHGGWEDVVTRVPLLMCGRPVRPGTYGCAMQTDIAPTVAALVGLPIPPYSQGRILDEALDLGAERARLGGLLSEQKEKFSRAYLGAIGADFEKVRAEVAPAAGENAAGFWDRVVSRGKGARIAAGRVRRVPLFLAVLLLPAVCLWYFGRKSRLPVRPPLVTALLFFAADYALFFGSGKRFSLSSVNDENLLQAFFNETMLYAAVSAVAMAVLLAFLNRKRTAWEAAESSLLMISTVVLLIILQVDFFFLDNGPSITWYIPDMLLGFKYYLDLMSLIAVGFISVIIPVVTLGAHRVWRWTGI
jgi:Type I phosphodiesterase / nucleotide pyrophosphatase